MKKVNKNIKPPRFYSKSEGVNPKKYADSVVKEREEKGIPERKFGAVRLYII